MKLNGTISYGPCCDLDANYIVFVFPFLNMYIEGIYDKAIVILKFHLFVLSLRGWPLFGLNVFSYTTAEEEVGRNASVKVDLIVRVSHPHCRQGHDI